MQSIPYNRREKPLEESRIIIYTYSKVNKTLAQRITKRNKSSYLKKPAKNIKIYKVYITDLTQWVIFDGI